MNRQAHPSDLTDEEWVAIQAVLPPPKRGRSGRPRKYPLREIWNAIFYQARTGCQWEYLPHDFPPLSSFGPTESPTDWMSPSGDAMFVR